jgi:hypothetical protein
MLGVRTVQPCTPRGGSGTMLAATGGAAYVQVPACWRQRRFFCAAADWEVVADQQAWAAPIIGERSSNVAACS